MNRRFALAKIPLCLLIGFSSLFGSLLANPTVAMQTFMAGLGIFVLATGAASLNSLQEYQLDSELERTRSRPLPQGLVPPHQAGIQALILLACGLLILYGAKQTLAPLLTAVAAVLLYNGVYTPLKKKTVVAILPGAVCGALPPYIGWLCGGGQPFGYPAALLIALFVLWQVPHFWLILLRNKEDYAKSRIPNLIKQFSEDSMKRFFVTWIGGLVSVMLMFLTLPLSINLPYQVAIICNCGLLVLVFLNGLVIGKSRNYRFLFIALNGSLFLHMVILIAGRLAP